MANIGRKISEGVAGWLMFEYHSFRGQLFSEKYLTSPIGNILSGIYGKRVIAEYNHPILNQHRSGQGRPPQVDFVITDENEKVEIAIESKWIGKNSLSVGDIIWDMIRLELLSNHFGAECFFVLAGQKKSIDALFRNERFLERKTNGSIRPVLRYEKNVMKSSIRLDSPPPERASLIKKKLMQYKNVSIPGVISSSYPEFYPKECKTSNFQVYVWKISSSKTVSRFMPINNSKYN